MDWKLVNYIGLDEIDANYKFKTKINYKLEGSIKCDFDITNLLSFGLAKECIDYKIIDIFEDINYENENFYGNLLVINNKYDLNFEYSSNDTLSMLNMLNRKFYKASFVSLKDYNYNDLEITLLTKDLFCKLIDNNEIFYCANLVIGINEL